MSLQHLHQSIIKALEEEEARLAKQAVNMRAAVGLPADEYAMVQCQTLATAYGLNVAAQLATKQYRLMVDPPKTADDAANDQPQQRKPLYG